MQQSKHTIGTRHWSEPESGLSKLFKERCCSTLLPAKLPAFPTSQNKHSNRIHTSIKSTAYLWRSEALVSKSSQIDLPHSLHDGSSHNLSPPLSPSSPNTRPRDVPLQSLTPTACARDVLVFKFIDENEPLNFAEDIWHFLRSCEEADLRSATEGFSTERLLMITWTQRYEGTTGGLTRRATLEIYWQEKNGASRQKMTFVGQYDKFLCAWSSRTDTWCFCTLVVDRNEEVRLADQLGVRPKSGG